MARNHVWEWLDANRSKLGSGYEELFVRNALSNVSSLSCDSLHAQYPFRDRRGGQRYCDFVIREGDSVRVAIEVDGFDKTGNGTGMSKHQWLDWLRRQNSFVSQGWVLLRFANLDVRDHPHEIASQIELVIRDQRSKASHVLGLENEVERLTHGLDVANWGTESYLDVAKELSRAESELAHARNTRQLTEMEREKLNSLLTNIDDERLQNQKTIILFIALVLSAILFFVAFVLAERRQFMESHHSQDAMLEIHDQNYLSADPISAAARDTCVVSTVGTGRCRAKINIRDERNAI